MLDCVVFVPSAPLLVPELAGPSATDTRPVREAVLAAGRTLTARTDSWVAIGAADPFDPVGSPESGCAATESEWSVEGTFAGFGIDVPVRLRPGARGSDGGAGRRLPLSMLVAGWLRGAVDGPAVRPLVVDPQAPTERCVELGRALGIELDRADATVGVLVVADGATALTARAPGGGRRDDAVQLQHRLDTALLTGDRQTLASLDPADCAGSGVTGRAAWQVSAVLADGRVPNTEPGYADAPFGVGYVVATWHR